MKILVIDDSPHHVKIANDYLSRSLHHEVDSKIMAVSAIEELASHREFIYKLIITDIKMPLEYADIETKFGGIEVARICRHLVFYQDTPIIFWSNVDPVKHAKSLAEISNSVFIKKGSVEDLKNAVAEIERRTLKKGWQ